MENQTLLHKVLKLWFRQKSGDGLEAKLGYRFREPELLAHALVHRSYLMGKDISYTSNNERLEFLGDSVLNMLTTEYLYKTFPNESKALLRGEYGRLPAEVNEEVRKKAIGDAEVITCRPADKLKPEMDLYREEIREYYTQEEDVLSYALFPEVSKTFFEFRKAQKYGLDAEHADAKLGVHPV